MGQEVHVPLTSESEAEDGAVSNTEPTPQDGAVDYTSLTINKWRRTKFTISGEEYNSLDALATPVMRDIYAQRIRTIVNEMERDCARALLSGALLKGKVINSKKFVSDLKDITKARKILSDAGCSMDDLQLVLNTEDGMNLRNLTQLQKVNEGGDGSLLRQGVLGNLFGFNIRESAGLDPHKNGDAKGFLVNGKAEKGASIINIDTGTGKFADGDLVYFGDDESHKYIVLKATGTQITLANELAVEVADNTAVNLADAYQGSVAFNRGGLVLATRTPIVSPFGDKAIDRTYITDPVSGITFEVAVWGGAYQSTLTFSACWGVKNIKGENSVALIA